MDYAVSIVGIIGFLCVGQKWWWAWYINLGCQVLWVIFALSIHQYGLLIGTALYVGVFGRNAYKWTRDRSGPKNSIEEFEAAIECVPGRHRTTECGHVPPHPAPFRWSKTSDVR